MSMIPKGGDTIWGDLDWSPEEGYIPSKGRQRNNDIKNGNQDGIENDVSQRKSVKYGRIISFGKDVAEAHSSDIGRIEFRVSLLFSLKFGEKDRNLLTFSLPVHVCSIYCQVMWI